MKPSMRSWNPVITASQLLNNQGYGDPANKAAAALWLVWLGALVGLPVFGELKIGCGMAGCCWY